ncbi:MAG: amine oxidoreductase, partial [Myxococcota bacterium]|nr:amine oxidoreductase [Myxococcota bacterium]
FVPYPFQNNIHRLPHEDRNRCLDGLIAASKQRQEGPCETFHDWIHRHFGTGLAEVFLEPYNFKVWAYPPSAMDAAWMGERVPRVDIAKVVDNILQDRDDVGWGPNATFRFPRGGGTGAIWEAAAQDLDPARLRLSHAVDQVDLDAREVHTSRGIFPFDTLINTMPLDQLVLRCTSKTDGRLDDMKRLARQLVHSSTHVVGLGLSGQVPEHLEGKCWMYFPEDDCPFYRVTVFSHYAGENVPDAQSQWSLMFEVSESPAKPVDDDVVAQTIQGALNTRLIAPDDVILSRFHRRLEYGYPTPFLGRDQVIDPLQAWLAEHGILSRGRFGGWKYEVANQDHSLMQGVEAVDRLLLGVEETTYWHPDLVNQRRNTTRRFGTLPLLDHGDGTTASRQSPRRARRIPGSSAAK